MHPRRPPLLPPVARRPSVWITLAAALLCLPLLVVITAPLHAPAPEWPHVWRTLLPGHVGGTLALLAGTLLVALLLGVPTAWLVAVHRFPGRPVLRWMLVLPLACPTYIAAFTYAALLGPTGSWSVWLHEHTGTRIDIMHLPGLCLVMGAVLFPYIHLPARAAFAAGMSAQLDAARTLGALPLRRFLRVALPLARPAIAGGAVLAAMETLNDYGAVKYFGIRTLTTGIFRSWSGLYDAGSALRLGAMLLLLIALLLWIERRARRGARHEVDQAPVAPLPLNGPARWLATGWCALAVALGAIVPLSNILIDAASTWSDVRATDLAMATLRTLGIANLTALATLALAVLFVFARRHRAAPPWMIRAANLGYVIPGAVIAVGVMTAAGAIDRTAWLPFALIGGIGLLTYAYTARFLAVAGQPLMGALRQQDPTLDDAARLLGASRWRTFRAVNLPLLRPALLAAATLVALDVVKELPLTLILRPFNFDTLSTKAFEMARIEQLREASVPALLIVLCGVVPVLLLDRLATRGER